MASSYVVKFDATQLANPRVDVMITILGDFRQFLVEKWRTYFLKM
jgi:hypothetical protein